VFEGRKAGNDPVTYSAQYTTLAGELLNDALGAGWRQGTPKLDIDTPDYLARQFQEFNVIRFSAAKSYAVATALNRLAGQATSFADFRSQAAPLVQNVNETWMRTEYDMTRQVGYTSAAYWRRVGNVENGYTAWKYETAGDDRVRPAHRALDGMTRPWDDPVWDTLQVPNGWRCRCDIVAVWGEYVTQDDLDNGRKQADIFMQSPEYGRMVREGFAINRAKLGVVFTDAQLYAKDLNERGLGVKANGVQSWASLNSTALPVLPQLDRDREDAITWYEQHPDRVKPEKAGDPDYLLLKDYAGRAVRLTRDTLIHHLTGKYTNQGRQNLLELLPEILENPDEVYLNRVGKVQNEYELRFIKFYQGSPIYIPVNVSLTMPSYIQTWHTLDTEVDGRRGGILLTKTRP
jgi:SPP1 gp7 family putative phage head morphogenesis protein